MTGIKSKGSTSKKSSKQVTMARLTVIWKLSDSLPWLLTSGMVSFLISQTMRGPRMLPKGMEMVVIQPANIPAMAARWQNMARLRSLPRSESNEELLLWGGGRGGEAEGTGGGSGGAEETGTGGGSGGEGGGGGSLLIRIFFG